MEVSLSPAQEGEMWVQAGPLERRPLWARS